ncbi:hypothetical protein Tco_0364892 [Tanacetum coccineum]
MGKLLQRKSRGNKFQAGVIWYTAAMKQAHRYRTGGITWTQWEGHTKLKGSLGRELTKLKDRKGNDNTEGYGNFNTAWSHAIRVEEKQIAHKTTSLAASSNGRKTSKAISGR